MSIIYLFCCATQFVWTSSPVSSHTSFGLPPARSPIKFLSALHSGPPSLPPFPPLVSRLMSASPSHCNAPRGSYPNPAGCPLLNASWFIQQSSCISLFPLSFFFFLSFSFFFPPFFFSLSFFLSPPPLFFSLSLLFFSPFLLNQRPVNRCHFGSLVLLQQTSKPTSQLYLSNAVW